MRTRSDEREPLEHGRDLVPAVRPGRADHEREVELRRRRGPVQRSASASATNSAGASSSARADGLRPSAASASSAACPGRDAGELQRVRQGLAPVGEGGLDDALQLRVPVGEGDAPERDERRVDVRARPEDLARDRVEAGSLGRELDEHRDGAVGLRRGRGEEPVGDLPLHHHAPELDGRQPVEALDDHGRGDVVRQVRDELLRRERGQVERERVAEVEVDVGSRRQPLAERRLERAVELDRVDVRDAVGEIGGEDAEARADLEHAVLRRELGEAADHAEDVLVGEEVLAELLLRPHAHAAPGAAPAGRARLRRRLRERGGRVHAEDGGRVRVDAPLELVRVLAARLRERRERVDDVGGLARPAAARLGREVRAVGLGEDAVGRHLRRRLAQLRRLRVGDVAGERDVPAPLEREREQRRRREAVEDHGAREAGEDGRGVRVGGARVDHDGLAVRLGEREQRLEEAELGVVRGVVPVVVEPGLADGDGLRMGEQLVELADVRASSPPASCGWMPSAA